MAVSQKRLPFTGAYNSRPASQNLIDPASAIAGIAIAGVAIAGFSSISAPFKDARFLNCFQVTVSDRTGNTKRVYVINRQGFAAQTTPEASSIGNAIRVWTGQSSKVMSCFGNTNSTLYDGTTSKGSITGLARSIDEIDISETPTLLMASSDSTGWYYQNGGSATKISDTDFPGNASRTTVGGFASLGGYTFIMDSHGRVYDSDLNSVTAWTAASYFSTNSIPDSGIGVVRQADTLIAFSKEHFEVLYNAGNPTNSPLGRLNERTQSIGCVSYDAITKIDDTIYFAGTSEGVISIYSMDGSKVQRLSTPEIENKLAYAGPSNISLTNVVMDGRHLIVINASTSTYVYCVEEQNWSEWTGTQLWYKADSVSTGSSIVTYSISKTSTSGKVFVLNPLALTWQDNGITVPASIQTSRYDAGTDHDKICHRIGLVGDMGQNVSIAWYDDDYITLSDARSFDMSSAKPFVTRCGRFNRRAFVVTHAANAAMRLEALELDLEECRN